MNGPTVRIIFLVIAIVCFLGTAVFINDMHQSNEALRVICVGLASFAASFIP